ncbi:MAG TPA: DMT family transporter [Leptolyngbyaceae cyanobacterium M33_DOE_097]|uniref:DMT family transporter n=1 Tax=Oscillatoriales cyanobacterium SpSt-418 TaxID=2282169 RepID=A0A7C3KGN8_9CYAN|nr:DMT family transporter [Leptolyngbyaceae cyanobacterium M33_DOE_097]
MTVLFEFRGELAALGAALIWAIASIVYTQMGRAISPTLLNLAKGLIAIALLLVTLLVQNQLFPAVAWSDMSWLLLSGAVGVGFGDTAYFQALQDIGPRRTLVLESLSPPLTALLALVFLQEWLPPLAWLGIVLTITGVVWVVLERLTEQQKQHTFWRRGVICGLLAALGQASGAVLSRSALAGSDINPLWSTLVRLVAGCLVLLVWLAIRKVSPSELKALKVPKNAGILVLAAFFSTYLGIWFQQIALKYAVAGVAQSLSATSPLFVLPIAALTGDRVSWRALFGVLLALAGIWLLFGRG